MPKKGPRWVAGAPSAAHPTFSSFGELLKSASKDTLPAATVSVPLRTNLPLALTRFVGRVYEITEIKRLVTRARLLALTGAGGVGKTRLALQAAAELLDEFPDGVWLVELALVNDPLLVPYAVAVALGLSTATARPLDHLLADWLRDKHLLLILDNCEHLLVACARLAEACLRAAPQLHIIATSRESLGMLSATAWHVPSLTLPTAPSIHGSPISMDEALRSESVQLFVDRATMSRPSWSLTPTNVAAVVAICRRPDGVPLAIELAATRLQALSAQQIADRLDDRFRLLTSGNSAALPRHQTLRAMVDWSYDLLSEPERGLLRQLSVFVGGWTLESAEWVGGSGALDLLMHLIDKSLVLVGDRERTVRYRMLETISQYAHEKLAEAAELSQACRAYLDWCRQLARKASPYLPGSQKTLWYEPIESEYENVRAAMDWAILHDPQAAVEMVADLWHLWFWRGYWQEGVDRARRVFAAAEALDTAAGACALVGAANLAGRAGDYATSHSWLVQGSAVSEALGITEAQFWAKIAHSMETQDH
jgi:predicted ATPase